MLSECKVIVDSIQEKTVWERNLHQHFVSDVTFRLLWTNKRSWGKCDPHFRLSAIVTWRRNFETANL